MPDHYNDLINCISLTQYTTRTGIFNLASYLPDFFPRPDLGPKLHIAYGTFGHPHRATTNLHLGRCDAINLMTHVGIPEDDELSEEKRRDKNIEVAKEAGCDTEQIERLKDSKTKMGAIWHIYHPRDSNKIRDLLNKVECEQGKQVESDHDPIHAQDFYLNKELRMRLEDEYRVKGYAIAQCLGDAVLIPPGAPYQVCCSSINQTFPLNDSISHIFCFFVTCRCETSQVALRLHGNL